MTISVERAGCFFGVSLIFVLLCTFFGMDDLVSIADAASGSGGHAVRLLRDYNMTDIDADVTDIDADVTDVSSLKVGLGFLVLCLLFLICMSFINSAYQGAMVHTVAKSHTKRTPFVTIDWTQSFNIFIYHSFYWLATAALHLLVTTSMAFFGDAKALPFYLIYSLLYIAIACSMIGAVPAIVVEKVSAIDAFKRSWNLCAHSSLFIFANYACFILLEIIAGLLFLVLLSEFNNGFMNVLRFVVPLVATLVIFPLTTILEVILYLNIRVLSEGLDLSTLEQELLLDPIIVNAMESEPLLTQTV